MQTEAFAKSSHPGPQVTGIAPVVAGTCCLADRMGLHLLPGVATENSCLEECILVGIQAPATGQLSSPRNTIASFQRANEGVSDRMELSSACPSLAVQPLTGGLGRGQCPMVSLWNSAKGCKQNCHLTQTHIWTGHKDRFGKMDEGDGMVLHRLALPRWGLSSDEDSCQCLNND